MKSWWRSLLTDIHSQPQWLREVMFGLALTVVVSTIGLAWFQSFETKIFVLLNPEPEKQEAFFAQRQSNVPPLAASFGQFGKGFSSMLAQIGKTFDFGDGSGGGQANPQPTRAYLLPVKGEKLK